MMLIRNRGALIAAAGLIALAVFLAWRLVRPMNIFVVSEAFERPVVTGRIPAAVPSLSAKACALCHQEIYDEWSTTIHSQAWSDPYFQVDWAFDGKQQICKNCHIPLDRQQEFRVLGFEDDEKWKPILEANPDFDPELQREGVTCAACHFQEGRILGVKGGENAVHPIRRLADPNRICVRCHVVGGKRWDMFYRLPPCGTVSEIRGTSGVSTEASASAPPQGRDGASAEPPHVVGAGESSLGCVNCHMPASVGPVFAGGGARLVRRHLWRGGHDAAMVRQGLDVALRELPPSAQGKRAFALAVTNVGAAHYFPTGTPDRHLSVSLRALASSGGVLREENQVLKRTVMWRPFIVDLWDTRLPRWQARVFQFELDRKELRDAVAVEGVVRYHLLDEARRRRIAYENKTPIAYDVYRIRTELDAPSAPALPSGPEAAPGTSQPGGGGRLE